MGLGTWLLKNGPGSPGQTARTLVDWHNKLLIQNQSYSLVEIFSKIYDERKRLAQSFNNKTSFFEKYNCQELMNTCQVDFALFVFVIMLLETQQFRVGIISNSNHTLDVLNIIKEEVSKKQLSLIKLSDTMYKSNAYKFINLIVFEIE